MKLTPLQWLWMFASTAFFVAVLLDIVNVIHFPTIAMAAAALLLTASGWVIGPSLKELERRNRRG